MASAAAAAPIDPAAVAQAQAAVARDAAEVRRNDSQLFQAIKAVESSKEREKRSNSMMFLPAIDPSEAKRGAGAVASAASAGARPLRSLPSRPRPSSRAAS